MKLINRALLITCLQAPIVRRTEQMFSSRMSFGNLFWRMVEQKIFREFPFVLRNRRESFDLLGIHDRQIQPGLCAVIKKNRVHHFACCGRQSKANVADSQHSSHERDFLLNQPDSFNRFYRTADVIFVARGARKYQRIENNIFRRNPVLFL